MGDGGSEWGINRTMAGFYDPYMTLQMLRWLRSAQAYNDADLVHAMKSILMKTAWANTFPVLLGEPSPDVVVNASAKLGEEVVALNEAVTPFVKCMVTVGAEKNLRGHGPTSGLDRNTVKEWNDLWQQRLITEATAKLQSAAAAVQSNEASGAAKAADSTTAAGDMGTADGTAGACSAAAAATTAATSSTASMNETSGPVPSSTSSSSATTTVSLSKETLDAITAQSFTPSVISKYIRLGEAFVLFGEDVMARKQFGTFLDLICDYCADARDNLGLRLKASWGYLAVTLYGLVDYMLIPHETSEAAKEMDASHQIPKIAHVLVMIDTLVDMAKLSTQVALMNRVWLLHWACYAVCIYYLPRLVTSIKENSLRPNIPGQTEWMKLLDLIFSDRSITIVTAVCPHLLRYYSAIAILNRRRESIFSTAIDCARNSGAAHSEKLSAFMRALFVDFDFDQAQTRLVTCGPAIRADFLLHRLSSVLEENCRLLVFETLCRIQRSISMSGMAEQLQMTADTAERWIVDLIRHSELEAKIDSENSRVEIATTTTDIQQQVIDATRGFRLQY